MTQRTADNLLNQLRSLVQLTRPLTHDDANNFAILFEWLDDSMKKGISPHDWDTRPTAGA